MNRDFWLMFTLFVLAGAGFYAALNLLFDWLEEVVGGWWFRRQCRRYVSEIMRERAWRHREWR